MDSTAAAGSGDTAASEADCDAEPSLALALALALPSFVLLSRAVVMPSLASSDVMADPLSVALPMMVLSWRVPASDCQTFMMH